MIKFIKCYLSRTKILSVTFKKYIFYELVDVQNSKNKCVELLKIMMGEHNILIIESDERIDESLLKKTTLQQLSCSRTDNYVYSFYCDVNKMVAGIELLNQYLTGLFAISFIEKPSELLLENANYKTLEIHNLYVNNMIDNALSCNYFENEMFLYISRSDDERAGEVKKFIKDERKSWWNLYKDLSKRD